MTDEQKKEYLQGLIDRIYVTYNAELACHEIKLCFRHPIVGDVYERVDEDRQTLSQKACKAAYMLTRCS